MSEFSEFYAKSTPDIQAGIREKVVTILQSGICTVVFTKKDGTQRTMRCTLNDKHLPAVDRHSEQQRSAEALSVWELDLDSWRSFRFDRLQAVALEP